ncbi:MAG: TetR/AcrR family transcriptional regulator [Desulfobacterales bacterium]|nr:MAG: TetR/AcrR family transcriptional regulator [Desulfobacterales bacterium]
MISSKRKAKRPRATRQQRRVSVTRQKLLEAARSVFAEKGLDSATIADITERADVGKGTFYYHFKDKNGVIAELIKSVLGELVAAIEMKCSHISDISELLDTMIGVHIEFFSNRWEDFVLYFQGRGDLHLEQGYEGIETRFVNYLESMEDLIESVIRGQISRQALRRIACAAAGFVSGYYSFAVIASEDEDVDKTLRSLRGALVASLTRFISESLPPPETVTKRGYS